MAPVMIHTIGQVWIVLLTCSAPHIVMPAATVCDATVLDVFGGSGRLN